MTPAYRPRLDLVVVGFLAFLHAASLVAPFCFTWGAFALFVAMSALTGMSITLGFHRLLTHSGFETYPVVRYALAFLGGLAGQGGVIQWVADHRAHHRYADAPGDPHSPREGFWWAHVAWTFPWKSTEQMRFHHETYCKDLLADPVMVAIHNSFFVWHFVLAGAFYAIGGWPWVIWGVVFRLVYVFHTTWFVNSVTHKYGYRNYATRDDSTNIWWVALTTFGEGWHNNHHAYPVASNHGHKPWEIDPTFMAIRLMERIGLAWKIKTHASV